MNVRKTVMRSGIIIAIILASVIFGVIFQKVSDNVERSKYPLDHREFVEKYSSEYGVPQNVIFAVIKTESGFDSSLLSDDGKIGLMQVSPETLETYKEELHDSYDTGMLYDPETNIKYGTYRLSKIYLKVGTWRAAFAAMATDEDTVLSWLADPEYSEITEMHKPKLLTIPDKYASEFTEKLEKTSEKYKELYFNK